MEKRKNTETGGVSGKEKINIILKSLHWATDYIGFMVMCKNGDKFDF